MEVEGAAGSPPVRMLAVPTLSIMEWRVGVDLSHRQCRGRSSRPWLTQQDSAVGHGAIIDGEGWGVVSPSELLPPAIAVAARENGAASGDKPPRLGEEGGESIGEEEVIGTGVTISVGEQVLNAGAVEDVGRVDDDNELKQ